MHWIRDMLKKYKEPILYLFFGGLTTVVNIAAYFVLADLMNVQYLAANVLAWVISVLFAYVTNRLWVFESREEGTGAILRELGLFVGCRLLSGGFDLACMYVCVDLLHINDLAAKIFSNIIVIILNYFFSKLIIFRKKSS